MTRMSLEEESENMHNTTTGLVTISFPSTTVSTGLVLLGTSSTKKPTLYTTGKIVLK